MYIELGRFCFCCCRFIWFHFFPFCGADTYSGGTMVAHMDSSMNMVDDDQGGKFTIHSLARAQATNYHGRASSTSSSTPNYSIDMGISHIEMLVAPSAFRSITLLYFRLVLLLLTVVEVVAAVALLLLLPLPPLSLMLHLLRLWICDIRANLSTDFEYFGQPMYSQNPLDRSNDVPTHAHARTHVIFHAAVGEVDKERF